MTPSDKKPDNVTQLRGDINRGETGDKVAGNDPAAAPLGTDEEAAGTPPSGAEVAAARQAERKPGADPAPNAANPDQTPTGRSGSSMSGTPVIRVLLLVVALALVVWVLLQLTGA